MASLGRCHPAVTVAAPTATAYPVPATAVTPRQRGGTTSTTPSANDAATAVCPLGKLAVARRAGPVSAGRVRIRFSSSAVPVAPPMSTAAATPRRSWARVMASTTIAPPTRTRDDTSMLFNSRCVASCTR